MPFQVTSGMQVPVVRNDGGVIQVLTVAFTRPEGLHYFIQFTDGSDVLARTDLPMVVL